MSNKKYDIIIKFEKCRKKITKYTIKIEKKI
jgi:hypothetical protein